MVKFGIFVRTQDRDVYEEQNTFGFYAIYKKMKIGWKIMGLNESVQLNTLYKNLSRKHFYWGKAFGGNEAQLTNSSRSDLCCKRLVSTAPADDTIGQTASASSLPPAGSEAYRRRTTREHPAESESRKKTPSTAVSQRDAFDNYYWKPAITVQ